MTEQVGMLAGDRVYRIHWLPGTDTLFGVCHCGAEQTAEEPAAMWDWLLAHPSGHQLRPPPVPSPVSSPRTEASV
ncbi:hypothetical protein JQS43_10835 [Natronosporangium hydrolyticum]|uniref:Uncharacterized protein n=1 Tax=Natronosporangium hydrolyticum TaxID=2811111 RepID=A0A895YN40_9ACTN|nr:hypothetical protein [Natronosporangium hydrolyticum]QSB16723.1 hypothetical protein JQS43_10835 [Natronosporangium hydrolyticum]